MSVAQIGAMKLIISKLSFLIMTRFGLFRALAFSPTLT